MRGAQKGAPQLFLDIILVFIRVVIIFKLFVVIVVEVIVVVEIVVEIVVVVLEIVVVVLEFLVILVKPVFVVLINRGAERREKSKSFLFFNFGIVKTHNTLLL
ncbi:MAG: hypothetical protein LBT01_08465 [Spirochaetaceae bacterium]|nr:hypothetical protein [Spirochaetaceae bacterium]